MEVVVLDASVGVKWFLREQDSDLAIELLERHAAGESSIFVPAHFVHEVLSAVRRDFGAYEVVGAWERIEETGIAVVPLGGDVVREAARQCLELRCTFCDALSPAVASLLGARLVSADARAHSEFPGVELIG